MDPNMIESRAVLATNTLPYIILKFWVIKNMMTESKAKLKKFMWVKWQVSMFHRQPC